VHSWSSITSNLAKPGWTHAAAAAPNLEAAKPNDQTVKTTEPANVARWRS
jgi:hypothetical protein